MIKFTDQVAIGDTKQTSDGYLVATAKVARTGVQYYLADELGDIAFKAGFKSGDVVRVNRPEQSVFNQSTLDSITRVPVTVDHPAENVTADNWSKYAVGEVGDAYKRDGEWIVVNPMIKDSAAIQAAKTTHKEISMGYMAGIVEAEDKSIADFEMTNIKMNHLALVNRGRAGSEARIGDSWGVSPVNDFQPGGKPTTTVGGRDMSDQLKTVVLGDKAVQVAVSDVAAIEQFKADSAKALADAKSKYNADIEARDKEIGELKAELKEAKDAANIDVDALVSARSELINQIKAIDSKIETQGKTDDELRKAAVIAKYGDEMVDGMSDAAIEGMFKVLSASRPKNPVADAFKNGINDAESDTNDAQKAYVDRLTRKGAK